ncbi:formyl peptide receptor-related sequence 4-like [Pelobates fuscus]|uniref:formyl peptide receptor-related sequence 4-like n=1 Tax=Pelobates fuscus TaxID=191477 RepID=UPI002FE4AA4C
MTSINVTSEHVFYSNWTQYLEDPNYYENTNFIAWEKHLNLYGYLRIPCIISYFITFIIGITGNSLVIRIAGFKMKSVSAVWFLNLAVTDLICNIALLARISEWAMVLEDLFYSKYVCTISTPFMFFNMLTSVYFLTVISIDRCVSIMWPIWSKLHRSRRLAKIISGIIWGVCLVLTLPHVIHHHLIDDMSECYPKYVNYIPSYRKYSIFGILSTKLVSVFAIPLLIMLLCYGQIALKLRTLKRKGGFRKPLKIITAVIISFFICWFPYSIWPLIILNGKYWKADVIISEISVCLAYFNSCINPILYVFICQDFKENFIKSLPARLENAFKDKDDQTIEDDSGNATAELRTSSSSFL